MSSTALFTDMYELTMLDAWIKDGRQDDPAVFEVFARRLQPGFRYGVVAGINRVREAVKDFRFSDGGIGSQFLEDLRIGAAGIALSKETIDFLAEYTFTGELLTYREGDLYFPGSPVVQVRGRLADVMLETVILSILNHDTAIASKAARIVAEARGKTLIEMGSRRTHEEAAAAAAGAAYLVGFAATSNLAAGRRLGVPVRGTAAHAFTLSYKAIASVVEPSINRLSDEAAEYEAFTAQVAAMGASTTLLVDTFDTERGIRNAVKAAGTSLGAIRIDSGDLAWEAERARHLLDSLGAFGTRIIVSSDLDEHVIKDLWIAGAPIDGFGVGTQLVSTPPAGMVYKLVEVNGVPVAKRSRDKLSVGGAKNPCRIYDGDGKVVEERLYLGVPTPGHTDGRRARYLLGKHEHTLEEARAFHLETALAELPENERRVWSGDHGPYITAEVAEA